MNFRRNGRRKTLGSWRNIPCCPIRTLLLPPGKSPASPQRRRNLGPNRAWKARSVREAQPMKDLDDSRAPLLDHLIEPIGRASCRERVCQYVEISGVAGPTKKKNTKKTT